jgi:hypothetical protein
MTTPTESKKNLSSPLPSLLKIIEKGKVVIEYYDEALDFECEFKCEIPNQRMLSDALESSTKRKGKSERLDQLAFAKKIFVPCVYGWNFGDADCSLESRMDFVGDNAVLNKMAMYVSVRLMQMAQANHDNERGN